jgi:hypothetical protein
MHLETPSLVPGEVAKEMTTVQVQRIPGSKTLGLLPSVLSHTGVGPRWGHIVELESRIRNLVGKWKGSVHYGALLEYWDIDWDMAI